ncbi:MAG: ferrous iron transport protein A [Thermoplasmata archaeon]|nr:ferrous iron transport protein A [Thermoplasmata archaeon]
MIMKLSQGEPGKTYVVLKVLGRGMVKRKIMDMGIVPGAKLRILGEAPLGDPMDVELNGTFLSIRKKEASLIEVEEL